MELISSAQNNEDVMLWRALHRVSDGFYVDVGAADPADLSVTRLFYEHGWRGINVEPDPDYFARLEQARPRDINLRVAAADAPGEQVFFQVPGTGLSTLDRAVADGHRADGRRVQTLRTPCRTLADICVEHLCVQPGAAGDIHFLKIDVEGFEGAVLQGADFGRFRPWIVLVEATRPTSAVPDHAGWEPGLLGHGYEFAWFDGLNRFYLAAERAEALRPSFVLPPNIFDGFSRAADIVGQAEAARAHAAKEEAARRRSESVLHTLQSAVDAANAHAGNEAAARRSVQDDLRETRSALRDAEAQARHETDARAAAVSALAQAE